MIKSYIKLITYSFTAIFILPIVSFFLDKEAGVYVQEIKPKTVFADLPVSPVPMAPSEGGVAVNYNEVYYDGGCDGAGDSDGGCDSW